MNLYLESSTYNAQRTLKEGLKKGVLEECTAARFTR